MGLPLWARSIVRPITGLPPQTFLAGGSARPTPSLRRRRCPSPPSLFSPSPPLRIRTSKNLCSFQCSFSVGFDDGRFLLSSSAAISISSFFRCIQFHQDKDHLHELRALGAPISEMLGFHGRDHSFSAANAARWCREESESLALETIRSASQKLGRRESARRYSSLVRDRVGDVV